MDHHAPIIITCSRCQAALAGVSITYEIIWQREQLNPAQANFADCAALLVSDARDLESLPATVQAKLDLPGCGCLPLVDWPVKGQAGRSAPLLSSTIVKGRRAV